MASYPIRYIAVTVPINAYIFVCMFGQMQETYNVHDNSTPIINGAITQTNSMPILVWDEHMCCTGQPEVTKKVEQMQLSGHTTLQTAVGELARDDYKTR